MLSFLFIIMAAVLLALATNIVWVVVMASAAIAYGSLSPVIAARRLYFLASALPHAALFAAVLAIPLTRLLGFFNEYIWAVVISLALTYSIGYLIHRGLDPDVATASFVALTASASVIAIYYVLTSFPVQTDITAMIIGDPLLASSTDAIVSAIIAGISLASVLLTYCEQVCIGIDRDIVRLAGVRMDAYDALLFSLLAVTAVALIKIVGFVLEHVLILLPSAISALSSRSAYGSLYLSLVSSLVASITGLYLALVLDIAPAGAAGLILLGVYVLSLLTKRGGNIGA